MKNYSGKVFHRRLDRPLPEAVGAGGVWIRDSLGNTYLDASGGPILVNVGHGREEVARAVHDQIMGCDFTHGTMFTTPVVEELARALAGHTPPGIERFYLMSTGSEANETAIKLARQIHLEAGLPGRIRLISRWKSYHGLTLGVLSAMGRTAFRAPFAPLLSPVEHIPPPYCLRCSYGLTHPSCGLRCALALEETILSAGPDIVSAFIAETVVGGTLAASPPPPGYLRLVRDICDRYGVLLILDEVMCGMGRTGRWAACEHYDVVPDLITLGKGLGGGAVPLSAVGVREEHYRAIREGSGRFVHGGTHSHHAVACAAGLAVIRIMEQERLVERVHSLGYTLGARLRTRLGALPWVADVRGVGFMWGIELVRNRDTLDPFPRGERVTERIWDALFRKGIITYPSTGLAGVDGDALMIAPPFIMEEHHMDTAVEAVGSTLEEVLGEGIPASAPRRA